jgi:hypothetical protein
MINRPAREKIKDQSSQRHPTLTSTGVSSAVRAA